MWLGRLDGGWAKSSLWIPWRRSKACRCVPALQHHRGVAHVPPVHFRNMQELRFSAPCSSPIQPAPGQDFDPGHSKRRAGRPHILVRGRAQLLLLIRNLRLRPEQTSRQPAAVLEEGPHTQFSERHRICTSDGSHAPCPHGMPHAGTAPGAGGAVAASSGGHAQGNQQDGPQVGGLRRILSHFGLKRPYLGGHAASGPIRTPGGDSTHRARLGRPATSRAMRTAVPRGLGRDASLQQ